MMNQKKQPTKALVLGGGGTTGIAWELGLLWGLHERGSGVTDADLIIGTSAGSVVGAQITSGLDLEELYAGQLRPLEQTQEQIVPFDGLVEVMTAGAGAADAQAARARVGAAALAAKTMPEEARLHIISARLPVQHWPDKQRLLIPAVNAQTGALVVFDRDAAVPFLLAVAASCAVPGIYPPTTIGDQRYIDGGVRSATNADLAQGARVVLILSTGTLDFRAADGQASIPRMTFEDELAALRQAGAQVLVITPDDASVAARGPNPLDSSRSARSASGGRAQGHTLAERMQEFWGK